MTKADNYMYEDIQNILQNGYKDENPRPKYKDGTPAHTYSVNHVMRKYDLSNGEFPITRLRPIAWKTGIKEILWVYQDASNNLNYLKEKYKVFYWDEWESKDYPKTIGKGRYGDVVAEYNLMNELLNSLKNNPYGRRHIIDLYQYKGLKESDGLYPCAFLTIWNVRKSKDNREYLDMCLIQRSGDMLTASGAGGINEVQYAALLMMVARHCGYESGIFTHFVANEHIYDRHKEQANEILNRYEEKIFEEIRSVPSNQLTKEKLEHYYNTNRPKLILNPEKTNFYDMTIDDFTMLNYEPIKPQLKLEIGI